MILAIETATLRTGVALIGLDDGRLLAARHAVVTTHSDALLGLVEEALHEAGRALEDLRAVACDAGPGSFTGLRIGLATAKGLCFALERPLVLVSSLATLAARAPAGALAVPCLDAFRGEVYAGFYHAGFPPAALDPEQAFAPAALADLIARRRDDGAPVHVIGDAGTRWPVLRVAGTVQDDAPPDPLDLGRIAAERLRHGDTDDLASAAPRYLRPSEAERLRLAELGAQVDGRREKA